MPKQRIHSQPFPPQSFAYILLDAPCSALGLRPRLQQTADLPSLLRAAEYQRQMLDAAVALLQPGGSLVYSTCTINPGAPLATSKAALHMASAYWSPFCFKPNRVRSL